MEAPKKERPGIICVDNSLQGGAKERHLLEVTNAKKKLLDQGFTVHEVDANDLEGIKNILSPFTENRHKIQILCGHSPRGPVPYQEDIKAVASGIAERGDLLLTPGSNSGLMKMIADEALAKGGDVIGISSSHVATSDFEPVHPGLSAVIIAPNEDERTAWYGRLADHIVVGPGGVGSVADLQSEIYTRYIDDMYRSSTADISYKPITLLSTPTKDKPRGHYDAELQMQRDVVNTGMSPAQISLLVNEAHTPAQVFESIDYYRDPEHRRERKELISHHILQAKGDKLDYRNFPKSANLRHATNHSMEHQLGGAYVNAQGGIGPEANVLVVDLKNASREELARYLDIIKLAKDPVDIANVPATNVLELNPTSMKRIQGTLWMDGRLDEDGNRSIKPGPVLYLPIQHQQKNEAYSHISDEKYFGMLCNVEAVPLPRKVKYGEMKDKAKFTPIAHEMGYRDPFDMVKHFADIYPGIQDDDTLLLYRVRHVRELTQEEAKQARDAYSFIRGKRDLFEERESVMNVPEVRSRDDWSTNPAVQRAKATARHGRSGA